MNLKVLNLSTFKDFFRSGGTLIETGASSVLNRPKLTSKVKIKPKCHSAYNSASHKYQ